MDYFLYIARLLVVFTAMPIHEFSHALIAHKLGDDTAKNDGRLTVNPFAHLDWIGTLLIVVAGFGWAKPVPVDSRNFKNRKSGMALTALAGPMSNIIMSFTLLVFLRMLIYVPVPENLWGDFLTILAGMLNVMIITNVSLAVFNLLPIIPLDGSRILAYFLPDRLVNKMEGNGQIINIILFAVIAFTDILTVPISIATNFVLTLLLNATSFVDFLMRML